MTPENVMELAHRMLLVTSMIAAPLLLIALIAGLVIGMLQAATQINEATLSFIPKLLVLVLALFITGPWILRVLIDFTRNIYASIPSAVASAISCSKEWCASTAWPTSMLSLTSRSSPKRCRKPNTVATSKSY